MAVNAGRPGPRGPRPPPGPPRRFVEGRSGPGPRGPRRPVPPRRFVEGRSGTPVDIDLVLSADTPEVYEVGYK